MRIKLAHIVIAFAMSLPVVYTEAQVLGQVYFRLRLELVKVQIRQMIGR